LDTCPQDGADHWGWLYAMGVMLANMGVLYIRFIFEVLAELFFKNDRIGFIAT